MTRNLTSWIKQYFSVEESTVVVLRSNSGRPEEEYQGTCVPLVVTSVTKCPRPVKPLPGFRIPCMGTGDFSYLPVRLYYISLPYNYSRVEETVRRSSPLL